ncbi:ER membrane protein complex subunit 6 [Oratosquilla oratoria]|uniref:ER membrane protein complex subunit 6 n=1 Tax=Oratosquilla oratoria TaxID=337810 RepID=UPI003F75B92D
MAGRVRTRMDRGTGELMAYSDAAVRNNSAIIEYCRTSMAALSGCTAGLLGLTALYGFLFFFVAVVVLWLMLLMKAGAQWQQYFVSRKALLTSGIFSGLFTYILFWTFLYGMVHVY